MQRSARYQSRFVSFPLLYLTLTPCIVQIQASGQRIQKFESLQIECGATTTLKITLHNNTRWGTAFGMLDRAHKLQVVSTYHRTVVLKLIQSLKPINLFISSADQLYGPITTLRRDGRVVKKVPWSAFALSDADWARVVDAKMILAVSFRLLAYQDSEDAHAFARILTVFFITFRPTNIQVYIARSPQSRTSKVLGKRNSRIRNSSSITRRLGTAWLS